ncbi:MAG: DoxX family protein [Myxococcota bacterium]
MRRLVATDSTDLGATVARLGLALVMFPHGAQKVLGWFGGYGLEGTYGFLTGQLGIPGPAAALAILVEFLAPLALAVGVGTRAAAAGIASIMMVAIAVVHAPNGFFMNWAGNAPGEGFEFHLLAIALAGVAIIRGGGRFSLDARLNND